MCGITGYSHLHQPQDRHDFERSLAAITHRGPDQQGVFYSHELSMGVRRLCVMDIDSGDQPFSSPDGDTTLVFNGEIFNHRELRAELTALGYNFRSHCDTEVVLHAFTHWGYDAFRRFRGAQRRPLSPRARRR